MSEAIVSTNRVIDATKLFSARKCPVGSAARHRHFGDVMIVAANEMQRTVEYFEYRPMSDEELYADLPPGIAADEILAGEVIVGHQADVHVSLLQQLDILVDLRAKMAHNVASVSRVPGAAGI